jgi:ATP-dependent DNA ligase
MAGRPMSVTAEYGHPMMNKAAAAPPTVGERGRDLDTPGSQFEGHQTRPIRQTVPMTAAVPFPPTPMLATAATLPTDPRGYAFEAKWDGIRALARIGGRAELFSRQANNLTSYFPEIPHT